MKSRSIAWAAFGLVAALSLLWPMPAAAEQTTPKAPTSRPHDHADDDVEEVDVTPAIVTPVQKTAPPSLLGKLHPLTVHIPIGWLLLLLLVELAALRWQWLLDVGAPFALLTVAAFVPALVTGFLRAQSMAPAVAERVLQHRNMMLLAAGALLVATITRWARRKHFAGGPRVVYLFLLLLAVAFLSLGGHLGGELVFGEGYLPF